MGSESTYGKDRQDDHINKKPAPPKRRGRALLVAAALLLGTQDNKSSPNASTADAGPEPTAEATPKNGEAYINSSERIERLDDTLQAASQVIVKAKASGNLGESHILDTETGQPVDPNHPGIVTLSLPAINGYDEVVLTLEQDAAGEFLPDTVQAIVVRPENEPGASLRAPNNDTPGYAATLTSNDPNEPMPTQEIASPDTASTAWQELQGIDNKVVETVQALTTQIST